MIAKRRIGHTAVEIRDFILETDLDGLPSEYCELLLKFIPTEEEVSKHTDHGNYIRTARHDVHIARSIY